jgi:transcriptional regulator with XRE-family HTH domain
MDMRKLVGRNFARLRLAKGFTRERFAEVERGERNPTVVTLYHLASALGVSPVELVMPDDETPREGARSVKRKSRKTSEQNVKRQRPADSAGRRSAWGQSPLRRDQMRT